MTQTTKNLEDLTQQVADRIATFRGETQLQLHLANLEAKEAWEEVVDPELLKIEDKLREAARAAGEAIDEAYHNSELGLEIALAFMEIRSRWAALEPYLQDAMDEAERAGKELVHSLAPLVPDSAKLQAHLAKLEAEDAVQERADEAQRLWSEAETKLEQFGRRLLHRVLGTLGASSSSP